MIVPSLCDGRIKPGVVGHGAELHPFGLVTEAMQPGSSASFVARRYATLPSFQFIWKCRMTAGGRRDAVAVYENVVATSRVHELQRRARGPVPAARSQDEQHQNPHLRARRGGDKKTDFAARLLKRSEERFAVRAVADAFGVRSNLAERQTWLDWLQLPTASRRPLLSCPRSARSLNEAVLNTKRVLRIMRVKGLTLASRTALRPGRTHGGVVVAMRSIERGCSNISDCTRALRARQRRHQAYAALVLIPSGDQSNFFALYRLRPRVT